jgi:uncharacterized surface protein with fasciclin (FAS1) repeats
MKTKSKLLTTLLLASVAPFAFASHHGGSRAAERDVVATLVAQPNFTTLVAAVGAAGLVETLQGEGPFTIFAPTDAAFAALPAGTVESLLQPENRAQLVAVLTYHVVAGKVMAKDVAPGEVATVNGSKATIAVNGGKVMIDGATVTATDLVGKNGVIHTIDAVILPVNPAEQDVVATLVAQPNFTTLVAAVGAAGLVETLQGEGPFTIFAPTDAAFAALPAGTVESLLQPENRAQLIAVLTYHVVAGKVMAKDVAPGEVATVNGAKATIALNYGKVMIDGATVTATDLVGKNGVIHTIDAVILP